MYLTFPLLPNGTILNPDDRPIKLTRKQQRAFRRIGDSLAGVFIDLDKGTMLLIDSTDENAINKAYEEYAKSTKDTHEHQLSPFEEALKYDTQNRRQE